MDVTRVYEPGVLLVCEARVSDFVGGAVHIVAIFNAATVGEADRGCGGTDEGCGC